MHPSPLSRFAYIAAVTIRGEHSVFHRLAMLRRAETQSESALVARQHDALAAALRYALENVPRYQPYRSLRHKLNARTAAEVLRELPLLEKHELQSEPENLYAVNWRGRTYSKTTGGSTGRPVTVRKSAASIAQEMAATWLAYGWFGIQPGDPCVRFWGQPVGNWKRRARYFAADVAMNRKTLSAFGYTNDRLRTYATLINRYKPRYLYGYVSAIEDLARESLASDISYKDSGLKVVITTSEVLSAPQREVIQQAFGVPVLNEYGCGEFGPIAYECPEEGVFHLLPTNEYVEILNRSGLPVAAGESGDIVITDLTNRAMPLLRYRVGDIGTPGVQCRCGRPFPTLQRVHGREYDFVAGLHGEKYHGEFFMYLFEDLRKDHPSIGQFQVEQNAPAALVVRVVTGNQAGDSHAAIRDALQNRLRGFQVTIEDVSEIPRQPSGKMRVVVNSIERGSYSAPVSAK